MKERLVKNLDIVSSQRDTFGCAQLMDIYYHNSGDVLSWVFLDLWISGNGGKMYFLLSGNWHC